jgi:hypothetical protein
LSFIDLRQVRDHVTESLANRNVVIEWTRDAVMGALECYPNLFGGGDREVTWRGSPDRALVKHSFDVEFPDEFVAALGTAIREGCVQHGHAGNTRPAR